MSTTIDQRVVQMQFDNRHFESNVATTMSTLDKLKQKLRLDGASKGLTDVSNSAKKVDMSGLNTGLDTVRMKFSAMEVVGMTALANITNSAVNAGKRMISALTIDPIKTGFQEYETQINSVQTILANTSSKGTTIDDVNNALKELNEYADQTIYNFTEMTRNIGTFTAAGIDLDTSVNAIQGIANLAAVSGSTSQQASTAMYQLSQALAAGTVKLMDWNSVVNAGMGGEVFQNALKETSKELGTGAEAAIKASGSFRESLRDGWLTSEVLTETLKKFTSSGANEYVAKYIGQSPDVVAAALKEGEAAAKAAGAVDEEAFAIEHASKALAEKYGKNADEIKQTLEFAKTATDAATKVKTFTQLWDVLKESAQSGWSQTWKIIIGDFEEAKNLLTPLSESLTGFINKMSDWRNTILESALGRAFADVSDKIQTILKPATAVMDTVKETTNAISNLGKIVDNVILGKFGNGKERYDALTAAGINYYEVQNKVNEKLGNSFRYSDKLIQHQSRLLGTQSESTEKTEEQAEATVKLNEEEKKRLKNLLKMSETDLRARKYTSEQITALKELGATAKDLGLTTDEFIDNLDQINGRWLLINSFKNIGQGLITMFKAMGEAWSNIFPETSVDNLANGLFNAIAAFHKFTASLKGNEETAANLRRTFEGVFAALDIVLTVVGGPMKIAFKALTQLLGMFDVNILDVTASIGDAVVAFRDFIDGTLDFTKIFEPVIYVITLAAEAFHSWINRLKESENLPQDIALGIAKGFGTAFRVIKDFLKKIPQYFTNGFDGLKDSPIMGFVDKLRTGAKVAIDTIAILGDMIREKIVRFLSRSEFEGISADSIAGLIAGFRTGAVEAWNAAVEMITSLVEKVKAFLGIHSPSTVFMAIGGFIIAGLVAGLQNGIPDSLGAVKDVIQPILDWLAGIDFGAILAGVIGIGAVATTKKIGDALSAFAAPFASLGDVFEGAGKVMTKAAKPIAKVIKNTAKVVKSFSKVMNAAAFNMRMDGIKTLATALLMLVGAIVVLTFIEPAKLWNAVGVILALAVILGVLAFAMDKISNASASIGKDGINLQGLSTGLAGLGIAILLLGITVKMVGSLNPEQAKQGFLGLLGLVLAIIAITAAFGLLVKGKSAQNIDKFGKTMLKLSIALLLLIGVVKLVSKLEWTEMGKGAAFLGGFVVFVALLNTIALMPSKNIGKLGGMLLKISLALILMVGVVKLSSELEWDEMGKGAAFLGGFLVFVGALAAIGALGGKSIDGVGKMMLGVSVAMLILVGVMKLIGMLEPAEFVKGLGAIIIFSVIIALLVKSIMKNGKDAPKVAATILAFSIAIGILAAVAIVCSLISLPGLAKGIAAVSVLAIMMSVMIKATRGASDVTGNIIAITVAIGILVAAVALLTLIDPTKLAVTTTVMTILMGMLALVIKVAGTANKAMGAIIAMAGVIAVIAGVLYLLSTLPVESMIASTIALSGLMLVMTGVLALMIPIGKMAKDAMMGALALATLAAPLALFGLVLAMMSALKVTDAIPNVIALSVLCTVLTVLLLPLSLIGALVTASGGTILLGVVALLTMAVPLAAFVGVLALMSGIQNGVVNAMALAALMAVLGDVLFKISIVAPLAMMGVGAITALIGLMTAMGVLAGLLGTFITPEIEEFIGKGINILEQLASGLGRVIASFITGFAGEVMTILPQLGLCLSQFMKNAMVFITGARMIDEQVLVGIGILTAAILAFSVAELVAGVASLGGIGLVALGMELSAFMVAAMPFIMGAKMITPESVEGIKTLAEAILILTAANVIEGLTSFLTGGSSLENFAKQLPILGQGLADFSASLGTFTEDQVNTVNCAAQAVKTLASAAAEIPNTGGLVASIVGENDLSMFASQFPILGTGLAQFLANIGTFTDEQVATVNCAAQAIKTLAQASSEIPNSGGWLGQIVGENDLGPFAEQFPVLGTGLRGFLDNVGTFTDEQVATVDCAAKAIKTLASAASEIPNSGGWIAAIVGENDLGTFAEQFPALGTGLAGFLTNVGTFTDEQMATVNCGANAVKSLAAVASTIPNEGGWISKLVGDNNLGTFAENFPKVGEGLAGFVSKLGTFTAAQVTTVYSGVNAINALSNLANADLKGATDHLTDFGNDLPDFAEDVASFCTSMPSGASVSSAVANLNKILGAVKSIASANSGPLATFAENLKKIGKEAVKKFVEAFTSSSAKTDLEKAAKALGDKVVDGIEAKEKAIKTAGTNAAKKAVDGVETQDDDMESAGKDLGSGLVTGINSKKTAAYNAGYALGQMAVQGEKDGQQSQSPSKLTIQAGKWIGEGLVIGMGKMGNQVYKAGSTLGSAATDTISSTISRISDMVSMDVDSQPTIRPVLDLSDVRSGVSAMSGMLNMDSSVGVRANIGAISSMMNLRSQNGSNSDVVSAIDKLRKDLGSIGGDTYQINGVTYDDGSNINDAVRTLVRAARIERRV